MSSSIHIDNKKKDILILGEGTAQGLDDITLTAEAEYLINFSKSNRNFCLSLHHNGINTFFVNATKICQFKAKDSEIKIYFLCLGKLSGNILANNMKKAGLNGFTYDFAFGYSAFDDISINNFHKYLMKKHDM